MVNDASLCPHGAGGQRAEILKHTRQEGAKERASSGHDPRSGGGTGRGSVVRGGRLGTANNNNNTNTQKEGGGEEKRRKAEG